MPTAIRPRARELVTPELALVMQARAQGKTFSLFNERDVQCTPEDELAVFARFQRCGKIASFLKECIPLRTCLGSCRYHDENETVIGMKRSRQEELGESGESICSDNIHSNRCIALKKRQLDSAGILQIVASASSGSDSHCDPSIPVLQCTSVETPSCSSTRGSGDIGVNNINGNNNNSPRNNTLSSVAVLLIDADILRDIHAGSEEGHGTQIIVSTSCAATRGLRLKTSEPQVRCHSQIKDSCQSQEKDGLIGSSNNSTATPTQ